MKILLFTIINFTAWNTGLCSTWHRHKRNAKLCLEFHNNRRPLAFTKFLFNENCYVPSLSGPLMAPVLLQVPQRCCNIWCWKRHISLNTHHLTQSRVPTDTSHFSLLVLLAHREIHEISLAYLQWQPAKVGRQRKNTQHTWWPESTWSSNKGANRKTDSWIASCCSTAFPMVSSLPLVFPSLHPTCPSCVTPLSPHQKGGFASWSWSHTQKEAG